jgi:hypothetical protein
MEHAIHDSRISRAASRGRLASHVQHERASGRVKVQWRATGRQNNMNCLHQHLSWHSCRRLIVALDGGRNDVHCHRSHHKRGHLSRSRGPCSKLISVFRSRCFVKVYNLILGFSTFEMVQHHAQSGACVVHLQETFVTLRPS